jgi:glutamate N-acetyltransferase/amino-acid N-acetyltransferase
MDDNNKKDGVSDPKSPKSGASDPEDPKIPNKSDSNKPKKKITEIFIDDKCVSYRPFAQSLSLPAGFEASAIASGARYKDRLDLGLIVADPFYGGAATFTRNRAKAAPLIWSKGKSHKGRVILANAGQANAQTGREGFANCKKIAKSLAELLEVSPDEVLLASTGVIGQQLNMPAILNSLPELAANISEDNFTDFASAIMTTDKAMKICAARVSLSGGEKFELMGCVKGSGMIAPNMATMLSFIMTDLAVSSPVLKILLSRHVKRSFNKLTVDGDTSTNDSVFILSSGASSLPPLTTLDPEEPKFQKFELALSHLLAKLSTFMLEDAEGATKAVTILIKNAPSKKAASKIARVIAESPLVKTAFYGEDPNWGRIIAAIGRAGYSIDPYKIDLHADHVLFVKSGVDAGKEKEAREVMRQGSFTLVANLNAGDHSDYIKTCDLSPEYVLINGSYRS